MLEEITNMSVLNKNISKLVDAINTKSKKRKSCSKLAQLFYDEKNKTDVDIINKTIEEINTSYRIVFIKDWCLLYVSDDDIDHATDIAKTYINKNFFLVDYNFSQGQVLTAIVSRLFAQNQDQYFHSIIADILINAKNCIEPGNNYKLVNGLLILFRKNNIQEKQIFSVLDYFNNPYYKDWSIWALLCYGYATENYVLRFKILLKISDFNYNVMLNELTFLFNDLKNDLKIDTSTTMKLLLEFSLVISECSLSYEIKQKILYKIKKHER